MFGFQRKPPDSRPLTIFMAKRIGGTNVAANSFARVRQRANQCAISTGTVMQRNMSRVIPPNTVSRKRE